MKQSRLTVIIAALVGALGSGGAILGSYFPNHMLYITITVAAVSTALLIFFGYTGHVVEKKVVETQKKPPQKKEKKYVENEDQFENVSSGR